MVKLVKIVSNDPKGKSTTYLADDGNSYVIKGDLNHRANNPGNISPTGTKAKGTYEDQFGAIGYLPSSNGPPVAVFPDFESGQAAQVYLWQTPKYQKMTLEQAAKSWAGNPYVNALVNAAGASKDTLVKDLSGDQLNAIVSAQVGQEGSNKISITDANGKPVPVDLAQQLGAVRRPPRDIPNGPNQSVAGIQQQLASNGFDPGKIDGINGPKTKAAVKAFQQANGLAVDGIVGPKTQAALEGNAGQALGGGPTYPRGVLGGMQRNNYNLAHPAPLQPSTGPAPTLQTLGPPPMATMGALGNVSRETTAPVPAQRPLGTAVAPTPMQRPVSKAAPAATVAPAKTVPTSQDTPQAQTFARLPSGKMVAEGTYPSSNEGSTVTITRGPDGSAIIVHNNPGLMNTAKMGPGTVAGGYIGQKLGEVGPQIGQALGNAGTNIGSTVQNFTGNALGAVESNPAVQGIVGALGNPFGMFGQPKVATNSSGSPDDRGIIRPPVIAPKTITTKPVAVKAKTGNGNGTQQPAAQTFKGSSTGRVYTVGKVYQDPSGKQFKASADGKFVRV